MFGPRTKVTHTISPKLQGLFTVPIRNKPKARPRVCVSDQSAPLLAPRSSSGSGVDVSQRCWAGSVVDLELHIGRNRGERDSSRTGLADLRALFWLENWLDEDRTRHFDQA